MNNDNNEKNKKLMNVTSAKTGKQINTAKPDTSGSGVKTAVIVLAGLIIIFGILLTYIRFRDANISAKNDNSSEQAAKGQEYEEVYNRIVTMTEETYPKTPDEVMTLYSKFYMLMYSNYLDDERLKELVIKGRIFFGSKLLEYNPESSQLLALEKEMNALNEENVQLTSIETGPCMASADDQGVYISYVTRKMSNNLTTSWKYYITESSSGLYKIRGWERAESK